MFVSTNTFVLVALLCNVMLIHKQSHLTERTPLNLATANATLDTHIVLKKSATQTVMFLTMNAMRANKGFSVKKSIACSAPNATLATLRQSKPRLRKRIVKCVL